MGVSERKPGALCCSQADSLLILYEVDQHAVDAVELSVGAPPRLVRAVVKLHLGSRIRARIRLRQRSL
jgi:hypothetical protein